MKIEKNTVVSLTYDLFAGKKNTEKSFIETADTANPFVFLYGTNGLIEAFEKNVSGLKIGDKFDFEIAAEHAYGKTDAEALVNLPKSIFLVDGKIDEEMLTIGNTIPMNDEEGHRMNGIVKEITKDEVIMDFNHPLADMDLHFKGEVIDIRTASKEELDHGHVHHAGMHDH
jgi:FKBP-type peptidyl-prolyl cis-trans isomerase SlyD